MQAAAPPPDPCPCMRLFGFVTLHVTTYVVNLATMVVFCLAKQWKYLAALVPAHLVIGAYCAYTAIVIHPKRRSNCCAQAFAIVVMGAMQGVQIKLAYDDFLSQRRARCNRAGHSDMAIPVTMPARFHCKAMDGILEGTIFATVAMGALLKQKWFEPSGHFEDWQKIVLYTGATLNFISVGLALMEVDHRTSTAVQKLLDRSVLTQLRHLLFRVSEFACRLLTGLLFCSLAQPVLGAFWLGFVVLALDYLLGIVLLVLLGGPEPMWQAALLSGVPLLMVNIMQFVDAPGMSLQARRISSIILPLRTAELLAVLAFTMCMKAWPHGDHEMLLNFLTQLHPRWIAGWAVSAIGYYLFLATYACHVKPGVDLHSAVAYGEVHALRDLLCHSDLVLDINRYGPDGRAPLHLAALRGQVGCIRLLVEERANLHLRTGNRQRNTALHLAAMSQCPAGIRCLKDLSGGDPEFLNAVNEDGDSAIHVAARRQNLGAIQELLREPGVDFKLKNCRGETAADFAANPRNFFFDRSSPEFLIQELLQSVEATSRTSHGATRGPAPASASGAPASLELSDLSGRTPSSTSSAPSPDVRGVAAAGSEQLDDRVEERHNVPLLAVGQDSERQIFSRAQQTPPSGSATRGYLAATNCGISSFLLSAGLGALSQTFLSSIQDGHDGGGDSLSPTQVSFEDFTDVKKLGEGAFGKVNLVRHKVTGELFAMKLMDKAKFKAQKITSKAHSEQYILKTTRHPFIVALHYAFQGSVFWVLVMEFCPNGDLQDALKTYGSPGLPLAPCARLMGEVLLALEHLHSIQVIFRDLKPDNVVLDSAFRAKVTDFGLAKKLYSSADAQTMCGSWGYVAPEIMTSKGSYTYAVDLYSYGVMLYLLLSGGEESPKKHQRLPPMRHAELRRKLRTAEKEENMEWMQPSLGALALLGILTSENPATRTSATDIKGHAFFTQLLRGPVDALLSLPGPFGPPGQDGETAGEV